MLDSDEFDLRSTAREDYDRIQARKLDALHFRLQQAINLKDDEIGRLKDEIAYLEAQINVVEDKNLTKTGPVEEKIQKLKFKKFKIEQKYELLITQKKTDFAKEINSINLDHQEQVKRLRSEIEYVMFNSSSQGSSSNKKETDEVDAFLESINSDKYRIKHQDNSTKSSISQPFIEQTLGDVQELENQNLKLKEHNQDLENQINKIKEQIADAESKTFTPSSSDDDEFDDISDDSFEYEDNLSNSQVEEIKDRFNEEKERLQKQHQAAVQKLKQQIEKQQKAIAKFGNENISIDDNDDNATTATSAANNSRKSSIKRSLMDNTQMIYNEIATMTDAQKEKRRKALLIENASLKREIGRLNYMVYGKSGKYAKWRNIKV
ncbi:hypothetical protein TVAG_028000 [Trichomonas vaginalis G3]|uniref:Uncharacterized protein n=1 Tax=Trichomonas vaginalis (strain ATCC PRA-98 / G3) TaxID=412133 RepID=A2E539_TRIV3|nr:hypothetical protein TVAGG3_0420730 [Trichomonas vaginalis G3]EAY12247.1 hypothetical protein TVAG_028000 [Trichomonas vaginalis G3]KAI5536032.1 hypothetical protein TVAGG3_0420730 [Trichomonas vaginalis G3]|eukprot:XP_001324470.1 hypothetical protein [Trichomonas vaginalis G3]